MEGIFPAWGRILRGYRPNLSIEITRECPLRCPGCYAYGDDHLGGELTLRQMADLKGDALVAGVLEAVRIHKPIHLSIIGGEPLVRFRELDQLLPILSAQGLYVQVVTSAVRPIPEAWAKIPRLQLVVSIDGLPAEHNVRRAAAAVLGMGPKRLVVKRGEYGALLFDGAPTPCFVPAYPLETEVDPTGAGDSFAGALLGYLAKTGQTSPQALRHALVYATTVASFCVEGVGTSRLNEVTQESLTARLHELRAIATLES